MEPARLGTSKRRPRRGSVERPVDGRLVRKASLVLVAPLTLLLLTLGLEYSGEQLRSGLRTGAGVGVVDLALCFTPGFLVGLALGWDVKAALLLGGVTWISSSGVVAKVLTDLGQMRDAATPRLLNVLVIEDLAVAVYLPVVGALVASHTVGGTVVTIAVAVAALAVCLTAAIVWGDRLSRLLHNAGDESLLLAVFGLTLLVGGLAEQIHVSAAIGAFLVGVALSGAAATGGALAALMVALSLFYVAGMYFNDAFDAAHDARTRPTSWASGVDPGRSAPRRTSVPVPRPSTLEPSPSSRSSNTSTSRIAGTLCSVTGSVVSRLATISGSAASAHTRAMPSRRTSHMPANANRLQPTMNTCWMPNDDSTVSMS